MYQRTDFLFTWPQSAVLWQREQNNLDVSPPTDVRYAWRLWSFLGGQFAFRLTCLFARCGSDPTELHHKVSPSAWKGAALGQVVFVYQIPQTETSACSDRFISRLTPAKTKRCYCRQWNSFGLQVMSRKERSITSNELQESALFYLLLLVYESYRMPKEHFLVFDEARSQWTSVHPQFSLVANENCCLTGCGFTRP